MRSLFFRLSLWGLSSINSSFVNWSKVFEYCLKEQEYEVLKSYSFGFCWGHIKADQITDDIVLLFKDKINWERLSWDLSSNALLGSVIDKINWKFLNYSELSEEFIREYIDYYSDQMDWKKISCRIELSEDFIRNFADRLDWRDISFYQVLSEGLIEEFADRVDWHFIVCQQKLSEDFIRKHVKYLEENAIRLGFWDKSPEFKAGLLNLLPKKDREPIYLSALEIENIPLDGPSCV